jgi:hypothetical protein
VESFLGFDQEQFFHKALQLTDVVNHVLSRKNHSPLIFDHKTDVVVLTENLPMTSDWNDNPRRSWVLDCAKSDV